ncbi:PE-PGRS family protein [Amycolatopsis sp.]|uniref:PE-PGRS family protein n=1 Tax=Amycolatopsis sp. TaxID=37632 RepID=UPI002B53143B|nr:PE-PGRS family protein [Amycolatopsis sp.]HVV10394.1 PE-PGRS family protein [Amycolatopsis sp.]
MTEQRVPEPVRRYESYSHEAMAAEVAAGNDPSAAGQIGQQWAGLGAQLRETMQALGTIAERSRESWQGPAGDAVRATLAKAAGWSEQATEVSLALSDAVNQQAGIAARARAEMPPPVAYDPVAMIREAAAGTVLDRIGLSDAMTAKREEAEAARAKAIDVMNARDGALRAAVPGRSFDPPPELS